MAKMGRPTVDTQAVNVRLPTATLQQVDDARKSQADLPTRPEMIRRMIDDWLVQNPQG